MIRAQIVTHWTPNTNPALPPGYALALFAGDVPLTEGDMWRDVTAQPSENLLPAPNLLVVEAVVSDATFAAILAHPDYGSGAVLWSETV